MGKTQELLLLLDEPSLLEPGDTTGGRVLLLLGLSLRIARYRCGRGSSFDLDFRFVSLTLARLLELDSCLMRVLRDPSRAQEQRLD